MRQMCNKVSGTNYVCGMQHGEMYKESSHNHGHRQTEKYKTQ